jgi:hypothetical protein
VTDWSGHIDVLVGAGIIILAQILFNILIYKRIKSIIRYKDSRSLPKWY